MRSPLARALPASLFVTTLVLEIAAVVLSWGLEPGYDTGLYFVYAVALAGSGALIASRHPENPIGWLFCATAVLNALTSDLAQGWGLRAAVAGWPAGTVGELVAAMSWIPAGPAMVLTFLLFPDGRLLRPAWQVVVGAAVVGAVVLAPAWAMSPATGAVFVGGRNPYAVAGFPSDALLAIGMALVLGSLVVSVVPLGLRLRRSTGVERQQVKWFVFAAVVAAVLLPSSALLWYVTPVVRPLAALALTALPVAACIAILRYRLYDIDVVISRTIGYAILTAILAAGYAASALVIGTAIGSRSPWAIAGATLVVAVAFRPLRDRIQAGVDRRFDRARYEAVRRVAVFLDQLRAGHAAPERIEGVLREALGVDRLELRFVLPETGRSVDLHGRPVPDDHVEGRHLHPIRRDGTILATVAADPDSARVRALLPRLIDTGGLAIEIARLRVELRHQLEQVETSRARIVAAAEQERRRIERDLHDGAQQRLVSIGLALRHAQHAFGSAAPEASRTLDGAIAEITVAIDELREMARGLRPAHLDGGLGPALRELARRAPLPVEVNAAGERFRPDIESAAYFIACEGLTNAVKHARASRVVLSAGRHNSLLIVRVTDDGVGGAVPRSGSGLTGLSDRVAAHGGTLTIDSDRDHGTTLTAEFPCGS